MHTSAADATQISRASTKSSDPGKTYRLDGTVLHVDTSCGFHCSEDYDITAPAGVAVTGGIDSNNLTLDGISTADVSVSSGDIKSPQLPARCRRNPTAATSTWR